MAARPGAQPLSSGFEARTCFFFIRLFLKIWVLADDTVTAQTYYRIQNTENGTGNFP